jgi:hypothetical protein
MQESPWYGISSFSVTQNVMARRLVIGGILKGPQGFCEDWIGFSFTNLAEEQQKNTNYKES